MRRRYGDGKSLPKWGARFGKRSRACATHSFCSTRNRSALSGIGRRKETVRTTRVACNAADCENAVRQMSRFVGEDLQPERFEQSHAQNVLVFVTDDDVVKKHPFQLETEAAVEIDIANIDVARVDINLP